MSRLVFAVLAAAIGCCGVASAQTLTAEQQAACKADYQKYCRGTMPGGGRIIACLNRQRDHLAEACKKVLDAQK
jgi:hypothetical protein